jgi:transposase
MSKRFVGIDLHKKLCYFTELDSEGNILRRGKFGNNIEAISAFAVTLSSEVKLTIEPVLNYLWFLDQVITYVGSVHPCNPSKVRVIAEAKTKCDRYDSRMLAELLRTNFLPESYYVPREVRALRDLIRQRGHLVAMRVSLKNRIRHLMFLNGSGIEAADVASPRAKMEMGRLCLSPLVKDLVDQCLGTIGYLNQKIAILEEQISSGCYGTAEVKLLQTIPGIGPLLAMIIYAETGDINRFKSGRAFASYCGLVPQVRASGDKVYTGSITKTGSRAMRTAFVEAAIVAARKSAALNRLFNRIHYKGNVRKARVAVAHKLALTAYAMLTKGESFRVSP